VRRQLVGVGAADYLEVLAGALARVGCEHALLVHGAEGMDELSVAGPSMVVEVRDGEVGAPYRLDPEECGLRVHDLAALLGGDPTENAAITRRVLAGVGGAPRDAVLLNAAAALYVAGVAPSILEGVEVAAESIDSGLAARLLDQLVSVTNEPAAKRR
jgi:anthranilate phosphoribosyltransferase